MACPVCPGAFSWREDLLHHLGAVHHLEDLIAHMDAEFSCESCPPCCRVPRSFFKYRRPQPANSVSSPTRARNMAQCKSRPGGTAECLNDDFSVSKLDRSDGARADGNGETAALDRGSPGHHGSSSVGVKSIERYHCDMCEFSSNDIEQLAEHSCEHEPQRTPSPDQLIAEPCHDVSPRQQVHFCDQCPFSTKHLGSLNQHMKAHMRSSSVKVGFRCGYCSLATPYRGSINGHLVSCHRGQPFKAVQFAGDEVVSILHDSASKTVKADSSSAGAAKKRRKLKLTKSKFDAIKGNSCSSQKTVTSTPAESSVPVSTQVSTDDKEGSAEMLENQLPAQMIYRRPVYCPGCDFRSLARVNLVRHIRLVHGNHQRSQPASSTKSCSSNFVRANCIDVDPSKPSSVPLQV